VLGVVSKTDLVRERAAVDATAAEILSPLVWRVPESASLAVAIELMVVHGIHQVPVVSADGAVVGVLGALDVVRWLLGPEGKAP
jgi:CBS domain-containing protein